MPSPEPPARQQRIDALGFNCIAQPKQERAYCNLCGQQSFIVLAHRDRYGFPTQACGCRCCGLVFLNPVMTAEAYQEFYAQTYRPLVSAYHGRLIDAETIQDEQRVYAGERAELLAPYLSAAPCTTLLDIGGSTGVVAYQFARQFGLRATIVDPAPLEIEQAQRLGLETISGLVEDFDPGVRRFDAVILCQTVDHLLNVAGSLAKIRAVLSPRGVFFVDIVDFRAAYLRNWCVEEAVKIDHPFYLTQTTIEAYLFRAGFEIVRMDYAADHLHVGYVCRLAEPRPDYLPPQQRVEKLWDEVRMVHNAPRGG